MQKSGGEQVRGKRDGTGPYKGSFRRKTEGKTKGRRMEAGEECPMKDEENEDTKEAAKIQKLASVIAENMGRERKAK